MSQSRKMSAVEAATNMAIGFVVAIGSQYVIFPWFDIQVPLSEHMMMGVFFTCVSLTRSYLLRRLFNGVRRFA